VQKRENRFFEMMQDDSMTFSGLSEWYLNLNSVKKLASFGRYQSCIANFNSVFGDYQVGSIKPIDIEDYQDSREAQGAAPATIDVELTIVGGMVRKAWDNDLISDRPVKAFRKVKNRLKIGSNARTRILTISEYSSLKKEASEHVKSLLIAGFNTGMRKGELLNLKWSHIDRKNSMIRLPAEMTKEKKPKNIPINHHVRKLLDGLPRALHHDYVFTY
jgi:integrase